MSGDQEHRAPLDRSTTEAAIADLDNLRNLLRQAGHGQTTPDELRDSLAQFWRDHGPLVRTAAWSAAELVRLQALSELYRWKDQLHAQLARRDPAGSTASMPSGRHQNPGSQHNRPD